MVRLTVKKIGDSLGVVLPAEALDALKVKEGDSLYLVDSPEGLKVSTHDPEFERTMEIAEEGMQQYRNALRELAK